MTGVTVSKTSVDEVIDADRRLTRLVYAYLACAAVWLLVGTLAGLSASLQFVWPDFSSTRALEFGHLRPVHTNAVLWGWASLGTIALALWVVPRTSQKSLFSVPLAWVSLGAINLAVLAGTLQLMSGVTNGAQEYREYVWPVMCVFWIGLALLAYNLARTVAQRSTEEIYISNWYIVGATLWTATLVAVAYLPWYQNGLGETVVQGYYMHTAVGMWFTPMVLGIMYYVLPKLLNKPIYSYSLGVLAFWAQLAFYPLIGAHHFVFSATPWWLQTVAIVFSVGMIVPVVAGTGNFLLTMRGEWSTIARSYSLPFILVGILFYFLVSAQGTLEAFRSLNRLWHFTDYTVGHAHLSMYAFVSFLIWGAAYGLIPRLTAREPPHLLVGVHFWFALVGVVIYAGALMVGGSLRGTQWINGGPFIDSVELMRPYWTARTVGGTLMFLSHAAFAYNVWRMRPAPVP